MEKVKDKARAGADEKLGPLRAKIDNLTEMAKKERAFLAPIRRLPVEVITEIITYDLASNHFHSDWRRKRQIAAVCRAWRSIILGAATLWTNIDSRNWDCTESSLKTLKRRLELSGSVGLHVSLYYYVWKDKVDIILEHFKVLAQAGVHRWRSLRVKHQFLPSTQPSPLLGIFSGKVSSLRSLEILDTRRAEGERDVFEPLYALIAETAPRLESFEFYGCQQVPDGFMKSAMFYNLKSLSSNQVVAADIMSKTNGLTSVQIYNSSRDQVKPFNLPRTVYICDITFAELSECNLDRVQDLNIGLLTSGKNRRNGGGDSDSSYDDQDGIHPSIATPAQFRSLHSLQVTYYDEHPLKWMFHIAAPILFHLIVKTGSGAARRSISTIQDVFVTRRNNLRIAPTNFDLQMDLSPASVIHIMDKWSQLVYLTISWTKNFSWNGFKKSMCRKKNLPCPNLRELRIGGPSDLGEDAIKDWREAATEILKYRKGKYPLELISLQKQYSNRSIVAISDV